MLMVTDSICLLRGEARMDFLVTGVIKLKRLRTTAMEEGKKALLSCGIVRVHWSVYVGAVGVVCS